MANMGYCRFRNTLSALQDVADHMDDNLDKEEGDARDRMLELFEDILTDKGLNILSDEQLDEYVKEYAEGE